MKRWGVVLIIAAFVINCTYAQTLLDSDGTTATYDLINSVLAPGYDVIEAPGPGTSTSTCDNHSEFGDHITQVYDETLSMYVFAFHIHVDEDNDRCKNFDRQRNEIKTYDKSPDNTLGVLGETVEYKWKFKLDEGFQPSSSFTHIHQLKSVGSPEDGMPLITLTPRKGTPDKLQLRYSSHTSQTTIHEVELNPFKGEWVEAIERVTYGEAGIGTYSISIETVADGTNLMTYSTTSLRMWKTDADFIRPKWGIYRSLDNAADLRDEIVHFANFSIYEEDDVIDPVVNVSTTATELNSPTFDISIEFGERVYGFEEDDIIVTNGSVQTGSLSNSGNVVFYATIVPDFNGEVTVSIPTGASQDAAGNNNKASNVITVAEDKTAPTVVVAINDDVTPPVTNAFGITISFSEAVTGFDETDIIVTNGQVQTGSLSDNDDMLFSATISPTVSGYANITVNVAAEATQDISGNYNEASNELNVVSNTTSSVHDLFERSFTIYPNPATNLLTVDIGQNYHAVEFSIIEPSGKILNNNEYYGHIFNIDISEYIPGMYIVRLKTPEGIHFRNLTIR